MSHDLPGRRRYVPLVLLALILTGCSAAVSGTGSGPLAADPTGSPSTSDSPAPVTTPASATESVTTSTGPSRPAGTRRPAPAPAPTATRRPTTTAPPSPSRSATPEPTVTISSPGVQGQVLTTTARSYCTSPGDPSGYAQIAWTTSGGSKVYILTGPGATSSTDARGSGGRGPYPYNGSATLPFDCSQQANYYRLDVYNIESHGGRAISVRYNA